MTKKELSIYAGKRFYNLSQRPGAKRGTIYCLTVYEITANGTCKYIREEMSCVANKQQWAAMEKTTNGVYHSGRPTAKTLTADFMKKTKNVTI